MSDEEFAALIAAVKAGDKDAGDKLMRRCEEIVRETIDPQRSSPAVREKGASDLCQTVLKSCFSDAKKGKFDDLKGFAHFRNLLTRMVKTKLAYTTRRKFSPKRGGTPTVAYSDLVIGSSTTELSSDSHPFRPEDVGKKLTIKTGIGFTPGVYEIVSVTNNLATMNRSVGIAGSTGGKGRLAGGAHRLLQQGEEFDAPAKDDSPSQVAMRHELREKVREQLTPELRRVDEMREQGYSFPEIAGELGETEDHWRHKLTKAYKRAREQLGLENEP